MTGNSQEGSWLVTLFLGKKSEVGTAYPLVTLVVDAMGLSPLTILDYVTVILILSVSHLSAPFLHWGPLRSWKHPLASSMSLK